MHVVTLAYFVDSYFSFVFSIENVQVKCILRLICLQHAGEFPGILCTVTKTVLKKQ